MQNLVLRSSNNRSQLLFFSSHRHRKEIKKEQKLINKTERRD
jgi:hypothetical protein